MRVGTLELIVLLVVVILIFGPRNLPKLARMLGKSKRALEDRKKEKEGQQEEQ